MNKVSTLTGEDFSALQNTLNQNTITERNVKTVLDILFDTGWKLGTSASVLQGRGFAFSEYDIIKLEEAKNMQHIPQDRLETIQRILTRMFEVENTIYKNENQKS